MNRFEMDDHARALAAGETPVRPWALMAGLVLLLILAQVLPPRTSPPTAEMFIKHALQLRG